MSDRRGGLTSWPNRTTPRPSVCLGTLTAAGIPGPSGKTVRVTDKATRQLLDRFVAALRAFPWLVSVWVHGSLAGGDYQPGRSDLDLIAVVAHRPTPGQEVQPGEVHRDLARDLPLAARPHCGYVAADGWGDPARDHLAWAHEELMRRPVTEVTRRGLHRFGAVRYGPPPADLVPPRSGACWPTDSDRAHPPRTGPGAPGTRQLITPGLFEQSARGGPDFGGHWVVDPVGSQVMQGRFKNAQEVFKLSSALDTCSAPIV